MDGWGVLGLGREYGMFITPAAAAVREAPPEVPSLFLGTGFGTVGMVHASSKTESHGAAGYPVLSRLRCLREVYLKQPVADFRPRLISSEPSPHDLPGSSQVGDHVDHFQGVKSALNTYLVFSCEYTIRTSILCFGQLNRKPQVPWKHSTCLRRLSKIRRSPK